MNSPLPLPLESGPGTPNEAPEFTEHKPLPACLRPGLVELSGNKDSTVPGARMTAAVSLVRHAQHEGETVAWVQPKHGPLFPPDLEQSGIDLDALVVIHVPSQPGSSLPLMQCKAAELLLRSGAFGLIILDFCDEAPALGTEAWQGRLLGLCRQNDARVLMLTEKPSHADSLGTLVGLRFEPRRYRVGASAGRRRGAAQFVLEHAVIKNKSGSGLDVAQDNVRGPWGLR